MASGFVAFWCVSDIQLSSEPTVRVFRDLRSVYSVAPDLSLATLDKGHLVSHMWPKGKNVSVSPMFLFFVILGRAGLAR